jgi:hypothetical protein
MMLESFMALPGVPKELVDRMQVIIDADMAQVVQVVGQVQKA